MDYYGLNHSSDTLVICWNQWLKWFCEAVGVGGTHLTKPGWSKPHTHSKPTNLALCRHKITLYRFSQGAHTIAGGLKWEQEAETPSPLTLATGLKLQFVNKVNSTFWCVKWALAREW